MNMRNLILVALAFSMVAFAQAPSQPGNVSTGLAAPGNFAEADGVYQLRYFANLQVADSYINATNAGTYSGIDPNGRICANFYGYDPKEEPINCCSCLITPNGLVSLSLRNDILSSTLTSAPLTLGITVKVLASLPTPVGGTTCNPSAPTPATLVRGLKLWAITPHLNTNTTAPNPPGNPVAPAYQLTETEFAKAELSPDEYNKLVGFCRFIQVAASGFGQCKSCPTVGAQGADVR